MHDQTKCQIISNLFDEIKYVLTLPFRRGTSKVYLIDVQVCFANNVSRG